MKNGIMRVVALVLLLYALFGFASALRTLDEALARQEELKAKIAYMRSANEVLSAKAENAFSDEAIEAAARERLALVMPGEKIFIFSVDGD